MVYIITIIDETFRRIQIIPKYHTFQSLRAVCNYVHVFDIPIRTIK